MQRWLLRLGLFLFDSNGKHLMQAREENDFLKLRFVNATKQTSHFITVIIVILVRLCFVIGDVEQSVSSLVRKRKKNDQDRFT